MSATEIKIGGEAGQGVILSGVVLAQAAARAGRSVSQSARYGAAVRGGQATADVVISDGWIDYPFAERPRWLAVLSQQTYDSLTPSLVEGGLALYDPFFVREIGEMKAGRQIAIPATERAMQSFGKGTAANLVLLSALVALSGVVSQDGLREAVASTVSARFRQTNLEALRIGRELAGERGETR